MAGVAQISNFVFVVGGTSRTCTDATGCGGEVNTVEVPFDCELLFVKFCELGNLDCSLSRTELQPQTANLPSSQTLKAQNPEPRIPHRPKSQHPEP